MPTLEGVWQALQQIKAQQVEHNSSLQREVEKLSVSGFMTFSGGKLGNSDFTLDDEVDGEWSFSQNNMLGLQLNYEAAENVSIKMQFITQAAQDYDVKLDWAFAQFQLTPQSSIRAGKLRVPVYMLSEYLNVGYAYPWSSKPIELYGLFPFSSYEGIDYRYWQEWRDWDFRFNPYIGTVGSQTSWGVPVGQLGGFDIQASHDNLTLRLGYGHFRTRLKDSAFEELVTTLVNGSELVAPVKVGDLTVIREVGLPGLLDYLDDAIAAAEQAGVANPANATLYNGEADNIRGQMQNYPLLRSADRKNNSNYTSIGLNYDDGKWQVMSELGYGDLEIYLPDIVAGYLVVGRRFGHWMPYVGYSELDARSLKQRKGDYPDVSFLLDTENPASMPLLFDTTEVNIDGLVRPANELYRLAVGASPVIVNHLNNVLASLSPEQNTTTLGLRWDPRPGTAVKLEYQRVGGFNQSFGFLDPVVNELNTDLIPDHIDVFRFSMDIIFE